MELQKKRLNEILTDTLKEWGVDCQPETVTQMTEHLLENGVFVLPCKVGDKIFFVGHISDVTPDFIYDDTITKIGVTTRGVMHERGVDLDEFNKTVFFNREDAEKALERSRKNEADT